MRNENMRNEDVCLSLANEIRVIASQLMESADNLLLLMRGMKGVDVITMKEEVCYIREEVVELLEIADRLTALADDVAEIDVEGLLKALYDDCK